MASFKAVQFLYVLKDYHSEDYQQFFGDESYTKASEYMDEHPSEWRVEVYIGGLPMPQALMIAYDHDSLNKDNN